MINYKASSEVGRSIISKLKVIDVEAVEEEQVDDDGNVIVEAVAEQSHNEIKTATTFNPDTGSRLADKEIIYNTEVEYKINDIETMISGLNEELESWKAIKSDYEALDDSNKGNSLAEFTVTASDHASYFYYYCSCF